MNNINIKALEKEYNNIKQVILNGVCKKGAKEPPNFWGRNKQPSDKALCIIYLNRNIGKEVSKAETSNFIMTVKNLTKPKDDQATRSLPRDYGYNVIQKRGGDPSMTKDYKLVDWSTLSGQFQSQTRVNNLNNKDWNNLKKAKNYKCWTCGEKEGDIHRDYGKIVKLQKGHMDPRLSYSINNIIPQCQFCNQLHLNRAVYNKKGQLKKFI